MPPTGKTPEKTVTTTISDAQDGYKAIKIPEEFYKDHLSSCPHSTIGRLTLVKGDTPWKHADLKIKLNSLWNIKMD